MRGAGSTDSEREQAGQSEQDKLHSMELDIELINVVCGGGGDDECGGGGDDECGGGDDECGGGDDECGMWWWRWR